MKRKVTLEEMRDLQLAMMDKIHEFCVERGIRYSLGGGTLLGAVRHKGYIPWDDDIDIMLPRPDYERFLKEFDGVYPNYTVQSCEKDADYCKMFAKVYDNRTILDEKIIRTGVYIDVFPIDGLPVKKDLSLYMSRLQCLTHLLYRSTKMPLNHKTWKNRLKHYLFELCDVRRDMVLGLIESFYSSIPFETSVFAGSIVGLYYEKEYYESNVFKSYMDMEFEGHVYKAISAYDIYLSQHYGDYMKLPPKEQQVSLHEYKVWWKE